jgi:ribonuclease P protein component
MDMNRPESRHNGPIVHKRDFERLIGTRPRARSAHFALHHVPGPPSKPPTKPPSPADSAMAVKLSTDSLQGSAQDVDNSAAGCWFGCVVPKRQARRAVTRNLVKRHARAAFVQHLPGLAPGLWLARLKVGYPVAEFVSARSHALSKAVRGELDQLFAHAAR